MITVATVVKDAEWFLERTVPVWKRFAHRIVALDNGSEDRSVEILRDHGAEMHWCGVPMQGNEWKVRKMLYEKAVQGSEWVLWLDADQILGADPTEHLKEPAVRFRVYDMWSETTYREDAWWKGHRSAWWWGIYAPEFEGLEPVFRERGWHSGHVPANLEAMSYPMPVECSILHYAYASPELRATKLALYESLEEHLTPQERFHGKTIAMPSRELELPFTPEWRIEL